MTRSHRNDRLGTDDDAVAALLHGADADAPPPPLQPGLAERVRTRARRQRQRQRVAAGGVLTLAAAASVVLLLAQLRTGQNRGRPDAITGKTQAINESDQVRLAADVNRASLEAEIRLAVARRLTAVERRRLQYARLERALSAAQRVPVDPVMTQREQAAFTMVDHADRLQVRAGLTGDALAAYRRAAELFPETQSADVARRRIEQLQSQNKT